jgi:hypothetical protein
VSHSCGDLDATGAAGGGGIVVVVEAEVGREHETSASLLSGMMLRFELAAGAAGELSEGAEVAEGGLDGESLSRSSESTDKRSIRRLARSLSSCT